jgi:carbonic anhydrase
MTHAFDDILAANRAYAEDFTLAGLSAPAAKGLGVLTCIDSRIEPLTMLGLRPGDAKIFRNAGARVSDDALRSLVLATNLLNVRRIMVVAHTDCAMSKTTDEELRETLGARYPEAHVDELEFGVMDDQLATLARDIARIRASALLPEHVVVAGFRYDVNTGLLEQVVDA